MLPTVLLSTVLLMPAQPGRLPQPAPTTPPRAADWSLALRLERAQEFVYRGSFTEECRTGTVQYQRSYRVESRLFVLDATPRMAEVACMTTLRQKDGLISGQTGGPKDDTDGRNIRVERFQVNPQGRLSSQAGVDLTPPLEGPATLEVGAFVELPGGRISPDQTWETEPLNTDLPPISWKATGAEMLQGVRCLVLKTNQQSSDWDQPRGDRKAWRRQDTLWVAPRTGMALKVERVVEMREPAHKDPTYKGTLRVDLETTLPYPGQLYLDRQADIALAMGLRNEATPLFVTPNRYTTELNGLLKRAQNHLDQTPPTPYRQAILQVKAQVEAALRGEVQITPTTIKVAKPTGLLVGKMAPDFLTTDINGKQSIGLKSLRGRPSILAFYNPTSSLTPDMLRFLGEISTSNQDRIWVLPLSTEENATVVQKQLTDLKLPLRVLQGSGLRMTYEVATTPRVVLLDAEGYVRGVYTGWGRDTPREILKDLKPWISEK